MACSRVEDPAAHATPHDQEGAVDRRLVISLLRRRDESDDLWRRVAGLGQNFARVLAHPRCRPRRRRVHHPRERRRRRRREKSSARRLRRNNRRRGPEHPRPLRLRFAEAHSTFDVGTRYFWRPTEMGLSFIVQPFCARPPLAETISLTISSVTFGSRPSVWPLSRRRTSATTRLSLQPS